jgi:hypothetical protein
MLMLPLLLSPPRRAKVVAVPMVCDVGDECVGEARFRADCTV